MSKQSLGMVSLSNSFVPFVPGFGFLSVSSSIWSVAQIAVRFRSFPFPHLWDEVFLVARRLVNGVPPVRDVHRRPLTTEDD